jgi:CCR4-NOT transcription complex subunit 7/8
VRAGARRGVHAAPDLPRLLAPAPRAGAPARAQGPREDPPLARPKLHACRRLLPRAGVVARPVGNFKSSREYHYKALKINVDMLKLIQLGLTFTDAEGNLPRHNGELCVWQFNFKGFKLSEDVYAQDSIELLKQSGIDFAQNEARGIDVQTFGEVLMSSGIVLNEDIRWITFHSGYDFGYLLKVLTSQPLPALEADFFDQLGTFFPHIFDIKYLMKFCDNLHGGLNKLAEMLDVQRIGPQHQAGSDSLLTSFTFLKLAKKFFSGVEGASKHMGVLYGLGTDGNNDWGKPQADV